MDQGQEYAKALSLAKCKQAKLVADFWKKEEKRVHQEYVQAQIKPNNEGETEALYELHRITVNEAEAKESIRTSLWSKWNVVYGLKQAEEK